MKKSLGAYAFFHGLTLILLISTPSSALYYPIIFDGETMRFSFGSWWGDKAGQTILSQTTEEFHSGTASLKVDMKWDPGYYGAAWGWNWAAWSIMNTHDASNATAVEIWAKTSKNWPGMNIWLTDATGTSSRMSSINGLTPAWKKFTIAITEFTGIDLTQIWEIGGDTHNVDGSAGLIMYLDDVKFVDPTRIVIPFAACPSSGRRQGAITRIIGDLRTIEHVSSAGNGAVELFDVTGRIAGRAGAASYQHGNGCMNVFIARKSQ